VTPDIDPAFIAEVLGGLVLAAMLVTVAVLVSRGRRLSNRGTGASAPLVWQTGTQVTAAAPGAMAAVAPPPQMPAAQAWQLGWDLVAPMGFRKLDAETYTTGVVFLTLHLRDGTLRGWVQKPRRGSMIESFMGARADARPGKPDRSALGQFVAEAVGEAMAALPRNAQLTVTGPEMPGAEYSSNLEFPLTHPDQLVAAARVLLALDEAASKPGDAPANLPPLVRAWQQATAQLEQAGFHAVDAECYACGKVFIQLKLSQSCLRAWSGGRCPGSVFEAFMGATERLEPGSRPRTDLANVLMAAVSEPLAALPRRTSLSVKMPEVPGGEYAASMELPFTDAAHAGVAARLLMALEELASRPAPAGPRSQLPPLVAAWQQARPMLVSLGFQELDAECYVRRPEKVFVQLRLGESALRAWAGRPCPGRPIEGLLRAEVEVTATDGGNGELGRLVWGAVREMLAQLPRGARLSVKAPEIPGADYSASMEAPFADPRHAETVARALIALDEVVAAPR
jgi:hypothetical protein